MRGERQKKVRKVLQFYATNFAFQEPYQILVDGTFAHQALEMKVNIKEQMSNYLGAECDISTTGCCLQEAKELGPTFHGAELILKQFHVVTCGHAEIPISASACLEQMTRKKNPDRYFVATQDREARDKKSLIVKLRKRPVPILYLHNKALTLEKPSDHTQAAASDLQKQKITPSDHQKATLDELKKQASIGPADAIKKRKRRGPKAPNPLSCKKPKKRLAGKTPSVAPPSSSADANEKSSKRRHKRVKMSDALKSIHQKLVAQMGGGMGE